MTYSSVWALVVYGVVCTAGLPASPAMRVLLFPDRAACLQMKEELGPSKPGSFYIECQEQRLVRPDDKNWSGN